MTLRELCKEADYVDKSGILFKGDCLEIMKNIPDGSVDMILCDLPYGTTQNKWDSILPLEALWNQYNRIIKDIGVIALFAQAPFDKVLGCSNIKNLRYEWIWEKNIASGHLNVRWMPMKNHENILIFYKEPSAYCPQMDEGSPYISNRKERDDSGDNYNGVVRTDTINKGTRYPKTVLHFDREIGFHPTQKPVPLLEYLIKTYSKENDLVLDNCMGSGSTGVACINTNRNFIGIELNEKYFNIAKERISNIII